LGVCGLNGAITGLIKSKMAADGHLGMSALSRITLASAGLSCHSTCGRLLARKTRAYMAFVLWTWKGSASTTNAVVLVKVIRLSKIPQGFVNTQSIVIKLHPDISDHITHPFTVSYS